MRKSITLRAFGAQMPIPACLDLARAAGFDGVEVNLEPGAAVTLDSPPEALRQFRAEVEARGLAVSAVYSRQQWSNPITSQHKAVRDEGYRIVEQLAEAGSILGTKFVLVVPGAVDNSLFVAAPEIVPYDVAYDNARQGLQRLLSSAAERFNVHLAIETVWNKFLLSPLEMAQLVDGLGSERLGVYLDVGNVLRTGFPEHWIGILGHRIQCVHFKDFRLAADNGSGFVNLLEGDVNWPAVAGALRSINYDSWITAEVLPAYRYHPERLIYETSASMDAIMA
jgi:hexulose-6-phosphate isomerase